MNAVSLRHLLDQDGYVLVPGAGSPFEARLIEQAGFSAVYVSGYATSAMVHGLPDIGIIGRAEMVENIERIAAVTSLPLIADADTGYGDISSVSVTVKRFEAAGATGIQIEDQIWPKRCGHLSGKQVVDRDTACRKIAAAVASRSSDDTLIVARTDALAPLGIKEAISRAKAFAAEGADVLFVDAPESVADLQEIAGALQGLNLIVNVSEGGRTPTLSADAFASMGFKIVLYPSTGVRVIASALTQFYDQLRTTEDSREVDVAFCGLDELNAAVGLQSFDRFEESVLASRGGMS